MPLKINSTGGGSVTLDSGSTPNNVTITLPGVNGTMATLGSVTNNGVIYVNSSGQPTSGSNLVYTATGLGIGTSSPAGPLQVVGTSDQIRAGNGTVTSFLGGSGSIGYTGTLTNHSFTFFTNSAERMRLDSSGNLGLGGTPSAWNSTYTTALQLKGGFAALSSNFSLGYANLSCNAYEDGNDTWKYVNNYPATRYRQSISGVHSWYTAPSGTAGNAISFTQAMTLDASGNLALGATTAIGKFYINAGSAGLMSVLNSDAANGGYIVGQTGGTTIWDLGTAKQAFNTGTSTDFGINVRSGFLGFGTNNTERMRIDSSGNLLVGTTTKKSQEKVSINFSSNVGEGLILSDSTIQNGTTFIAFYTSTSRIGAIVANGTTNVSYNTSSDYRLKENIQPMQNALGVVAQLNPVTYTWKADGSDGQGFIAHELQAVVPDCVTGEKDAVDAEGKPMYQGIDTSFLVATLTKAIQEQQELINQLTARVAQLEK